MSELQSSSTAPGPALFVALVSGLVFGAGLLLSGMTDPVRVRNFLDVLGHWDPSLLFTLGAAVLTALVPHLWFRRSGRALLLALPPAAGPTRVDGRLVAGAAVFGLGWGLAGYCPGPALVAVGGASWPALEFVFAMLGGIALHRVLHRPARSVLASVGRKVAQDA